MNTLLQQHTRTIPLLVLGACLLLNFAFSAALGQWQWQNPLPQGNGMNSINFVSGETGWATIGPGGLLKTTDGGVTWEQYSSPERLYTLDVFFTNENLGWVGGQSSQGQPTILFRTTDGGHSWEPSLLDPVDVRTILFVNERQGWASGQGSRVWHTTDGGITWELQSDFPFSTIHAFSFTDSLHGWGAGSPNRRVHTTDGGISWLVDTLDHSIYDIQFLDSLRGWQCGDWKIESTTDGGNTWQVQLDTFMITWQSIFMLDGFRGWAVSQGYPGLIAHTTNGGLNWMYQTNPTGNPLTDVFFVDELNGFIVGGIATFLKTKDSGQNWESITNSVTMEFLRAIHVNDPSNAWVAGNAGTILRTSDGGLTWYNLATGTSEVLNDVYFVDMENGWAVGEASTILRTSNAGYSWEIQTSPVPADWADLEFSQYPIGWIVGEGKLVKSEDGGMTWMDATNYPFAEGAKEVQFTSSMIGWIMAGDAAFGTEQAAYRTSDYGTNWTTVVTSNSDTTFLSMSFVSDSVGWISTLRNTLVTDDGGKTWGRLDVPVPFGVIDFVDLNRGWAATASVGDIYETTDGGITWISQNAPSAWIIQDIKFYGSEMGWAVGTFGSILHTSNGGTASVEDGGRENQSTTWFKLHQNYPNPFNSETNFVLELDRIARESTLDIYNVIGERVYSLPLGVLTPGVYTFRWDGISTGGKEVSSGIYFIRIVLSDDYVTRKFIFLR